MFLTGSVCSPPPTSMASVKRLYRLQGEVNSAKNTTTNIWLNDVLLAIENYMFRPIAAIIRF